MAKRISVAERKAPSKKPTARPAILAGTPREGMIMVSPGDLEPNPYQPRGSFDDERLRELAASIAQDGIIEPIVARPGSNGKYQIVAGERRWRAARTARVKTIPIVINNCSDEEMEILALEENLHREDLNDVDRGKALKALKTRRDLTWDQLGKRIGLSRRRVLMLAGLAELPEEIQTQIEQGRLTEKHSRAISRLEAPEQQKRFMKAIQRENISGDRAMTAVRLLREDSGVTIDQAVKKVARAPAATKGHVQGAQVRTASACLAELLARVEPDSLSASEHKELVSELASLIKTAQDAMKRLKG